MSINNELSKIYNQSDIKEHAKKKSMWGGSFDPSPHSEYVYDDGKERFIQKTIVYADSLYKNYDEIIVNVVDVWIKHKTLTKEYRVTKCVIDFDKKTGYITIFNNGQGIPIDIVKDIKGEPIYIPQLISTEFLAGSNNENDESRITGGVNGIGMTMVNNNSKHFILKTTDLKRKKYYTQECHNRLDIIETPVIISRNSMQISDIHKKGGTTVKFLPAYDIYKFDINKNYDDLNSLFKARAIQISAHTNIDVIYNGENVLPGANKMKTFAKMFMDEYIHLCIKHPIHNWDVIVGLSNQDKFQSLSIINGVCVKTGNHLNYIRDHVIDNIKHKVEKIVKKYREYKKSMIQNNLFIIISGNIPNPSFDSQTKTNISGSINKYKDYTIGKTYIAKIWKFMEPVIIEQYTINNTKKKISKISTSGIKKYKAAKYVGKEPCTVLICEGDSAESMTRTALVSPDVDLNYNYFGTFNIGGVPINARTKSNEYIDSNNCIAYRRQKMLIDNERWSSFEKIMNLNHEYTYTSDKEFNTIAYTSVVMAVDQDLDGVGQICGLILSNIHRFWPALISRGVCKHLETPIIRAYPKKINNDVVSFYTDEQYRTWAESKNTDDYEIKYYKGLATHNDAEAIHMFRNYHKSLHTFTLDDMSNEMFNIYYGDSAELRRKELVKEKEKIKINNLTISCTNHLQTHTKDFQLDNIKRKLPNIYDGLNPSRRKILCASRKRFINNNKEVKVFQLASYVAEHMNYHHGVVSLESTIVNMAQNYVGSNNTPLLLPLSQFGTRMKGGKDSGASRYIKTKLNSELVSALFKDDDDYVIEYTSDEGVYNEPVHYMPIAPYILMESIQLPASGWKYCGYSRSWSSIYNNILQMFHSKKNETKYNITPMPFQAMNWNGELRYTNNGNISQLWSMGTYLYDEKKNTVEITELPYKIWNQTYTDSLETKKHVIDINDMSSKLQIDIKVKLKPDAFDDIQKMYKKGHIEFDVIEEYLGLKTNIDQNLNVIKDGSVEEYKDYESIIIDWFNARYTTYKKRFERLIIIIKLRIMYMKEVIKFVDNHSKYNFSVLDEDTANKILKNDKYIRFNKTLLDNPKFTPINKIEELVCGNNHKTTYNYLYAIGPKQRMQNAREVRSKKLKELEEYYKHITGPDIILYTWRKELNDLNNIIVKAQSHEQGWLYSERSAKFKN
jgi:DNA topoisomerase-2